MFKRYFINHERHSYNSGLLRNDFESGPQTAGNSMGKSGKKKGFFKKVILRTVFESFNF